MDFSNPEFWVSSSGLILLGIIGGLIGAVMRRDIELPRFVRQLGGRTTFEPGILYYIISGAVASPLFVVLNQLIESPTALAVIAFIVSMAGAPFIKQAIDYYGANSDRQMLAINIAKDNDKIEALIRENKQLRAKLHRLEDQYKTVRLSDSLNDDNAQQSHRGTS